MIQSNRFVVENIGKKIEAEVKLATKSLNIHLDNSTTVVGNGRINYSVREERTINTEIKELFDISMKKICVVESTLRKVDNKIEENFFKSNK